ncbi:MAG: 50S ribosomal protein L19 [Phycisphaeraceae bacterium]|nr:50S ribosomal protein L19 [Phycisphaeraceae bacterium]
MSDQLIRHVEQTYMKSDLPKLSVGDTVDVHVRIIEGNKERIQVFSGVIIAMQGRGLTATMTVRRIVANEGVERTFPVHSPKISKVEVKRHGHVRRAKLFYLRERVGKSRRLRDRRRGLGQLTEVAAKPESAAAATEAPAEAAAQ